MQFYGSKEGLFLAMMEQAAGKSDLLLAILTGPRPGMGARLTRAYLEQWEDPVTGDKLRSLFRAAVGSPRASSLYKNVMAETLMKSDLPVPKRLPSLLAVTQLLGTAIGRYLIELPGLVAPSLDELVRLISPTIDRYFDAD
jgi:AcrR family transcriptional regulator